MQYLVHEFELYVDCTNSKIVEMKVKLPTKLVGVNLVIDLIVTASNDELFDHQ